MITYTLVTDGASDECLVPIIDWTIASNFPKLAYAGSIATDLPALRHGLAVRVKAAIQMFPCDIVFVHRDAEGQAPAARYREIVDATEAIAIKSVGIVPVRMMEAWLLHSEAAIRKAAGNPNGATPLQIPNINVVENLPDPKQSLLTALTVASNLGARRRAGFNAHARRRRVAECIEDFAHLRQLPAFMRFEEDLRNALSPT